MNTTNNPIENLPITESNLPGLPFKKATMQMADFKQYADQVCPYILASGVILVVEEADGNSTILTSAATYELFRAMGLTDDAAVAPEQP